MFPQSPNLGLYASPGLPAVKLGKILLNDSRVKQPGDVAALYLEEGFWGKTYVILTSESCIYPDGKFELADVKGAEASGKTVSVAVNRLGALNNFVIKVKDDEVAQTLARVLTDISRFDPQADANAANSKPDYSKFEGQAIDWLLLRDEVMKTIDLLFEKFNDGKLSLLEFEEKKAELLARL
jgi:hypothetical protein